MLYEVSGFLACTRPWVPALVFLDYVIYYKVVHPSSYSTISVLRTTEGGRKLKYTTAVLTDHSHLPI